MNDINFTGVKWVVDLGGTIGHIKAILVGSDKTPTVARYDVETLSLNDDHKKANAHLIAAAPDMYLLLRDILNNYETDTHMDNQINVVLSKARGEL